MANRMVREGLVDQGRKARVAGTDRLAERARWFPEGIVRLALICSAREAYCMGQYAGIVYRSVVQEFRALDRMY